MLHHGHIAVVGLLFKAGLAFVHIFEFHFLVFTGFAVEGRAGEGGIKRVAAVNRQVVTQQLQVQLGVDALVAGIDHIVLHRHIVSAALEGKGFDQFHAIHLGRLQAHGQAVLPVLQGALARLQLHHGLVRGVVAANQAGLRHIAVLGRFVQQHHGLAAVGILFVVEQLGAHHGAAFGAQGQAQHVGGDHHGFAHGGRFGSSTSTLNCCIYSSCWRCIGGIFSTISA